MSNNIFNRLLTALMLAIAIISFQELTPENPDRELIIRIERPKNRIQPIYSQNAPLEHQIIGSANSDSPRE